MAKTNDLSFISYYLPAYRKYADGQEIFGGYGPRLFDWEGLNQLDNVVEILKKNPDSRKAVIQLFDAHDITEDHKDIPCTCTIAALDSGEAKLHMITYMRSNDAFVGLPHDVFCFTMLQELMARSLGYELGQYKHMVGSLHLYKDTISNASRFPELKAGSRPRPQCPRFLMVTLGHLWTWCCRLNTQSEPVKNPTLQGLWRDWIRIGRT